MPYILLQLVLLALTLLQRIPPILFTQPLEHLLYVVLADIFLIIETLLYECLQTILQEG
jgi:hypothetical protein